MTDQPNGDRAANVEVTDVALVVTLTTGERIEAPLADFPRLLRATVQERIEYRLEANGQAIRWEAIDEDIAVWLLRRHPGRRP